MTLHTRTLLSMAIASAVAFGTASYSRASENGLINYLTGQPGPFVGFFPEVPGLFGISQTTYFYADGLYDGNGKKTSTPFDLSTKAEIAIIVASYDFKLFDARVYSMAIIPYLGLETSVFGNRQSDSGLGNVTVSPIILNWTIDKFQSFTASIDIVTPISDYGTTNPTIGTNFTSISPNFAYRYSDPDGLEFGILPRLLFNSENTATAYQSGTALVVDFMLNWHFGKWTLGVVGGYAKQLEGDLLFGRDIGNKFSEFRAGPSIRYDAGPMIFNLNWQPNWMVENGANTSAVWFNVVFPLYVAGGPPGQGAKH